MKSVFGLGIFLLLMFTSCGEEAKGSEENKDKFDRGLLEHRWEVDRAYRNGKKAATLDDLYFVFDDHDSLRTNMVGQDFVEHFVLKGDSIKTTGNGGLFFVVQKLDSTSLVLETNYRATPFRFQLKKAKDSEE